MEISKKNCSIVTYVLFFLVIITTYFGTIFQIKGNNISRVILFAFIMFFTLDFFIRKNLCISKRFYYEIIVLFYWIFHATLSLIWCRDINLAKYFYISLLVNLFLMIMIFLIINDLKTYNALLICNNVGIAFLIIIGIWEVSTGNHLVVSLSFKHVLKNNPTAIFGNANDFATYLFFGIPPMFFWASIIKKKYIFYMFFLISSFLIYKTGSRSNMLAIIIFTFFYLVLNFSIKKISIKKIIYIIIIFLVLIILYNGIIGLIETNLPYSSGNTNSDIARISWIISALNSMHKYFYMGMGPGQSILTNGTNLHNFWVEILVEYGVLVFCLFIFMWIRMFKEAIKIYDSFSVMIISFIIASQVSLLSSSSAFGLRIVWIVLAIIILFLKKIRIDFER